MKTRDLFCSILVCGVAFLAGQANGADATDSASQIPHFRQQGTTTQLIVDGKPFLALCSEVGNNHATSLEFMKPLWSRLVESKVNTLLAGVSWAQIEPEEGKFDFRLVDGIIQECRSHNLRFVPLWFASWKNSLSSYPPGWVKRNFERFPRAQTAGGKSIELLSPLSDANRDADARAFAALMRHIKEIDSRDQTVIMVQLENEVGMHGDSRDRSPAANQAFAAPVPRELLDYLQQHRETLIPEFRKVWEAAGGKTVRDLGRGLRPGKVTDGIFMAWYYARYMNRVAEAGKAEYPIPMFTNAALYGINSGPQPASGGRPWDLVMDVWKAGGPKIDMLSPDSYSERDFVAFCAKYDRPGNPLFVPENMGQAEGAARVLYIFGRHNTVGWTAMGLTDKKIPFPDNDLTSSYDLLRQLAPLISAHQGDGTMSAVLMRSPSDPPQKVRVGNYTLEVKFHTPLGGTGVPKSAAPPPPAAAIFLATGPDEYFLAGSGLRVTFSPNTPGPPLAGLDTVEEGTFVDGRWVPGRSLAGDDSNEGECVMLAWKGIQRVTLYRYQ